MTMKFRAHETFFIRKGWLTKGMKNIARKPIVFVDRTENPMDVLGIGSNMVKSLRYWLQVTGLSEEGRGKVRGQFLTELGKAIFEHDRYLEELGTLYLVQYKLATNLENATAWYFFFNKFNMREFSRDDFVLQIQKFISAVRSLEEDFNCIINTYVPRYKTNPTRVNAENNIDCPLGEIGLVDIVTKKTYRKAVPDTRTIDPWVALAILSEQNEGRKEISLNSLLTDEGSIGKVFNLDALALLEVLRPIEKLGEIKVVRTAGLDVVQFLNQRTFMECINRYYKNISKQAGSEI